MPLSPAAASAKAKVKAEAPPAGAVAVAAAKKGTLRAVPAAAHAQRQQQASVEQVRVLNPSVV